MTKKLEDFFNLPPAERVDVEVEIDVVPEKSKDQLLSDAQSLYSAMSAAEKVDLALPTVFGLEAHDNEMDDIALKAVRTFEDLIILGGNVPDLHAGKIYEVAGQMLKTALEAKNSKAERKLKMIDLQLKKLRVDQTDVNGGTTGSQSSGGEFDRNELLKYIVSSKSESSDK